MLTDKEIKDIRFYIDSNYQKLKDEGREVCMADNIIRQIQYMKSLGLDTSKMVTAIVDNSYNNDSQKDAFKIIRPFLRDYIMGDILDEPLSVDEAEKKMLEIVNDSRNKSVNDTLCQLYKLKKQLEK